MTDSFILAAVFCTRVKNLRIIGKLVTVIGDTMKARSDKGKAGV